MSDSFSTEETVGYGSRVTSSLGGALFGLLLFVVAFPLEFWNEGRAVAAHKALDEGANAVVSIAAAPLDPANNGKLVHASAVAMSPQVLADPDFGLQTDGLVLSRHVEMYQWKERKETRTEKNLGGSEQRVTTYHYETKWDDDLIDSTRFAKPEGHKNPDRMPFDSRRVVADPITLGELVLGAEHARKLDGEQALPARLENIPPNLAASFRVDDGRLVTSADPDKPAVGDIRVTFRQLPEQRVSVVGVQRDGRLEPFVASNGNQIALLESGEVSADKMFAAAHSRASMLTWILRGVGVVLMWIGLSSALGWIATILDFIPFLGGLVRHGVAIVAGLLSVVLSAVTIAVAWFFYRPLVAIALLAVAGGAVWLLRGRARRAMPPPPPPASAMPPPPPR
ncbi:TMEM43 family protein [Tahibacter amnicola]|uniref:TMEM43 family protein n=1 Tax=Tahibacter amnicola TaxID=2976241 RepID=A0ABY6BCM4_9GAMM|nr:TMEM43 family protein [Tahibacter amnicola]UXI67479.1 TMEM43 family protein [Tahibacter amnicola]